MTTTTTTGIETTRRHFRIGDRVHIEFADGRGAGVVVSGRDRQFDEHRVAMGQQGTGRVRWIGRNQLTLRKAGV